MVNDIIAAIDTFGYFSSITTYIYYNGMVNWLKSLKERCTWKPSDEQMQILHWCMPLWVEPKSKAILESLINDLKKLKE